MINRAVLIGRLTRDPELRRTQQGDAVVSFTLAINRNYTSKDGQQQADFINCVAWKKLAENIEKYCAKGRTLGVEGRLQSRSYDNAQGQKVFVTELFCTGVQFLGSNQKSQSEATNEPLNDTYNSSQQIDPYNFIGESQETFDIDPNDIEF